MRIGPLILLQGCVMAWHWSWSLTWRWGVWIHRHRRGTKCGLLKMRIHQGRGWMVALNTPVMDVHFQSQPNMRRDLVVNREEAYRVYADALGRRAEPLTDAEKQMALLNAVIENGEALLENGV